MYFIAVFVLLGTGLTVNSEIHSLKYIYTAFSKPVGLPGIHEFTAMGLLDGRMIHYYDSDLQKKVPKEPWMKERLPADYWEKGTQSCLSKQQWFKVNIDILKKRMNQTDEDVHILQWMHGCEGKTGPDGGVMFRRSVFMFNYDGRDFLSFDDTNAVWVASTDIAVPTKRKWDGVQVLKEYYKGYLESECIDWLNKFMTYGQEQLKAASPPDVYVFATNTKTGTNVMLTCLATGFKPKDIKLEIKRDGRVLTKEDGLLTSGVRPNEDDTYQRRDSVEILRSDVASYRCEVTHRASGVYVEKIWDRKPPNPPGGDIIVIIAVVTVVVLLLVIVAAVLPVVLLYKKGKIGSKSPPSSSSRSPSPDASCAALPATTNNVQGSHESPIIDDSDVSTGGGPNNHQGSKSPPSSRSPSPDASSVPVDEDPDTVTTLPATTNNVQVYAQLPNDEDVNKPLLKDEKEEKGSEGSLISGDSGVSSPPGGSGGGGHNNHQGSKSPPSSRSPSPDASSVPVDEVPDTVTTLPATTNNVQGSHWSLIRRAPGVFRSDGSLTCRDSGYYSPTDGSGCNPFYFQDTAVSIPVSGNALPATTNNVQDNN